MSERERELVKKIAKLPADVQDRIADQLEGAITAVEVMRAASKSNDNEPQA